MENSFYSLKKKKNITNYFRPNERRVLKIIKVLTQEKIYTDGAEIMSKKPKEWTGCGTGNIQNALAELFKNGNIVFRGVENIFDLQKNYSDIQNIPISITEKGEKYLRLWVVRYWKIIIGIVVSLATIWTAIILTLDFFVKIKAN